MHWVDNMGFCRFGGYLRALLSSGLVVQLCGHELGPDCFRERRERLAGKNLQLAIRDAVREAADGHEGIALSHLGRPLRYGNDELQHLGKHLEDRKSGQQPRPAGVKLSIVGVQVIVCKSKFRQAMVPLHHYVCVMAAE